jgi:hypothetical protein
MIEWLIARPTDVGKIGKEGCGMLKSQKNGKEWMREKDWMIGWMNDCRKMIEKDQWLKKRIDWFRFPSRRCGVNSTKTFRYEKGKEHSLSYWWLFSVSLKLFLTHEKLQNNMASKIIAKIIIHSAKAK